MPKITEIERTSNSNGMQFVLDSRLTQGKKLVYKSVEEAKTNDLASSIFSTGHITEIRIIDRSVTVFQDGEADWSSLLAQIAPFVREATPIGDQRTADSSSPEASKNISAKRQAIVRELRSVIDPEIGVNIVDLGLVYNIFEENGAMTVEFTATTPGCPMQRYLQQEIEEALEKIDPVSAYQTKLVWKPSWSIDMIDPDVELFSSSRTQSRIL